MLGAAHKSLEVTGPKVPGTDEILTSAALAFVGVLCAQFTDRIDALLAERREAQARFDAGDLPRFLPETESVRADSWRVAEPPADLVRRTVEITGPVDPKMIINALNSGADVFMADFEDSSAPTWANMVGGQLALRAAVRRELEYVDEARAKHYRLRPETQDQPLATLLVRPRGLHLPEAHLRFGGRPAPAALVDFGLYLFHNAEHLLDSGSGPYFYLPKLQSHLEARLWNEVFVAAQDLLGIPRGSIRATVLIETLPAAFEMDEILFELREHSSGLNCGRWDYIFSYIKTFRADPSRIVPDRSEVGMTQPFMRAYTQLLIRTCHRRGIHAMGGMAAQIPRKDDLAANEAALAKVREDKLREARDGHDGTWVAHPGLIAVAREAFARVTEAPNQLDRLREDVEVGATQLCAPPHGQRTEAGLRLNVRVGIQYLEAWLSGNGCVPLYHLMEDAATAEISRAQVWQWRKHAVTLADGRVVDADLIEAVVAEELDTIRAEVGEARFDGGRFELARDLFLELALADELADFLTLGAYAHLPESPTP
ncbi:Malate synthase A [Enhygromyxa salina]|uniref:Malate synthase n=1 Tax=Enhygromyxa salina TaxID=215803 RepID=A0A2S9XHK9_9BACT|nr:malate synthase A [Enhygromyxa salina]PRP92358.1 Malate synthase A [Enhygromyxa salina]